MDLKNDIWSKNKVKNEEKKTFPKLFAFCGNQFVKSTYITCQVTAAPVISLQVKTHANLLIFVVI